MSLILILIMLGIWWTTKDPDYAIAASISMVAWSIECLALKFKK